MRSQRCKCSFAKRERDNLKHETISVMTKKRQKTLNSCGILREFTHCQDQVKGISDVQDPATANAVPGRTSERFSVTYTFMYHMCFAVDSLGSALHMPGACFVHVGSQYSEVCCLPTLSRKQGSKSWHCF